MGALSNDQSMEEILSSIKRIIADEDSARANGTPRPPRRKPAAKPFIALDAGEDDQILELTDAIASEPADDNGSAQDQVFRSDDRTGASVNDTEPAEDAQESEAMARQPRSPAVIGNASTTANSGASSQDEPAVISDSSAAAVRDALSSLSSLLVKPADAPSNTLEGLVQDMLRPMLKEWLDANLPGLVETMVKREIEKITGRV